MFLYFLLFVLICVIYYVFIKQKNEYWKSRNVVHASEKSLFDTLWEFVVSNRSLPEIYKDIYDKFPNEPYVGIFLGSKPALLIRDPNVIQQVFAGDFQSFYSRGINLNFDVDVLADNLLFMGDYQKWKVLRQKISPLFTSARLRNMFYIMERSAKDFVEYVDENKQSVDKPYELLTVFTAAALGSAVFGIDTKSKNTIQESPFLEMTRKSTTPSFRSMFAFFLGNAFPKLFKILKLKAFGEHEPFFLNFVKDVLQSRRREVTKRHDFVDLCVEIQKNGIMKDSSSGYELEPTDEILAAQAFFFFLAGIDTSSNSIHFTLLELAQNPQILEKVHNEIDNAFDKGDPSYDEVEKLTYLDMVLNESMRKYPNIGLIQRECTRDTVITVGNLKIDKGTLVVVPTYALHRDATYYPEPDKFDPERFAQGFEENRYKYVYLPFGEGNRICLGARFARLQMKCGLVYLLKKYTVKAQNQQPLRFEPSTFSVRATNAKYTLLLRDLSKKTI